MSKEYKNIYDLLNEVEFDTSDEKEIPLNDLEKKKIKNIVRKKVKKALWKKKGIIVASVFIVAALFSISPLGKEVIAEIKERFFFNPGIGVVNAEDEMYILKQPIMLKASDKEVLIKNIISNKKGVTASIWIQDEDINNLNLGKEDIINSEDDVKSYIHIKAPENKELEISSYNIAGGGRSKFIVVYAESNDILEKINLQVYDEDKEVELSKVEEGGDFNAIGGNYTDNNILIGGNKYIFDDNTYISLWSEEEYKDNGLFYIGFDEENIDVVDSEGNIYELNHSEYSGNSKEFVINKKIEDSLNLRINKIDLEYSLKNPIKLKLDIPKKGEIIEINKEIYIEELDEKILLKSIKSTEEGIEIKFDTGKYKKENSDIIILGQDRPSWGIGSSDEDRNITMGVYNEDLTLIESLTGKIKLKITRVHLNKYGNWKFEIN